MRASVYICDICGTVKGETNHWFSAYGADRIGCLTIGGFEERNGIHLCGEACVQKWVSKQLSGMKEANV